MVPNLQKPETPPEDRAVVPTLQTDAEPLELERALKFAPEAASRASKALDDVGEAADELGDGRVHPARGQLQPAEDEPGLGRERAERGLGPAGARECAMNSLAPMTSVGPPGPAAFPRQAETDDQLLRLWLHGRPGTTTRAYSADVDQFIAFVGKRRQSITVGDLQEFADTLTELSDASRARKLSAVKSLLRACEAIGILARRKEPSMALYSMW